MKKKRILIIGLSPLVGGVETYIYNLVTHLHDDRYCYEFLIIGKKKPVFKDELEHYFHDNVIHFHYVDNLKSEFFKGIKELRKLYKENAYSIIYLNTCTAAKVLYCLPGMTRGSKLIVHSHNGNGNSVFNNMIFQPLVNHFSAYRLTCSDLAAKWLYGNKSSQAILVNNGIDCDRFQFKEDYRNEIRKSLGIDDNIIVLGSVARFSEQKNHKLMVEIAKKLPQNYLFLCIGDGPLFEDIRDRVKRAGLVKRFVILPSSKNIQKYYSSFDAFIMPSKYEGLPISAIEAQCNGLFCLFSNNVSKQVALSDNCSFTQIDSADKWVDIITHTKFERYNGRAYVESKHYDIQSTCNQVSALFNELMENN